MLPYFTGPAVSCLVREKETRPHNLRGPRHSAEIMRRFVEVQVCFETSALPALWNLVVFGVLWTLPCLPLSVSSERSFRYFFPLLLRTSLWVV
jgi:hypothetical protein